MTEEPDADEDGATDNDDYEENEDPSTMGRSAPAATANSSKKRAGPKTTGNDVINIDASSDKKQRASKPSSAPGRLRSGSTSTGGAIPLVSQSTLGRTFSTFGTIRPLTARFEPPCWNFRTGGVREHPR
jgi:hypothetical protein